LILSENRKILVTGGAGFIGSHTVLALMEHGYEPIIVDNFTTSDPQVIHALQEITGKDITVYDVDCTDIEAMRHIFEQEPDMHGVIHFAAYKAVGESVEDPLKYYRNNLFSMVVLLELMKAFEMKNLVFSSSCTIYGQPLVIPVTEETPIQPAGSPYGDTKQQCEQIIRFSYEALGLKACLLRYFNPIGAHPSGKIGELPVGVPSNLVPYVQQTAAGIRERLRINGGDYNTSDGTCIRDYIHVSDLAEAHVKALEWLQKQDKPVCEPFNLGVGRGNTVLEVVRTFEEVNLVKIPYDIGPRRAGDVEQIYADNSKAVNILGWQAKYSLADAMKHAWQWQQYHDENW
jgi:UDP-glucose 4-epimerase